ncbi:S41 family peptidase [Olivibacter sitiensis]|uniref:S41 family peptidase n=1 Tax=Olivibacter sitiensis TaxID=376470 RepID=UPI0006878405|nr:S41 family peptidase [Olivibacter sitiensis]
MNANHRTILGTLNLVIDLRGNGGGADGSFRSLIPYLYTNPIRTVGVKLLSTKQNNQAMLNYSQDDNFNESDRKWFKDAYEKLDKNLGKFVQLNDDIISIQKLDTIYPQPKNIAIIINEVNASTTEQFLLAAKQSKKVKLFGTTTFGALDISNMTGAQSPCGEFELWYCVSKSHRIPDMAIDGKGIQPDYYIDKSIPPYKWVDFVNKVISEN